MTDLRTSAFHKLPIGEIKTVNRFVAFGFKIGIPMLLVQADAAQIASKSPEFEVASVKVAKAEKGMAGGCRGVDSQDRTPSGNEVPLGRCVITDARLSHLIYIAYGLSSPALIKSEADWIARGDLRFDVEAQAEATATTKSQQLHEMLQTLLVERFKLKFHREIMQMPGFAMTSKGNGSKLKHSSSEEVVTRFGGAYKPKPGAPVSFTGRKYSITMLADLLSQLGGRGPIIDKTELPGDYDFELSWDENAGPDLSTALREQLGLQLEPQKKVPVSFFVVDSAEKPTEN